MLRKQGGWGETPLESLRILGVERQESILFWVCRRRLYIKSKQRGWRISPPPPGKFENFRCRMSRIYAILSLQIKVVNLELITGTILRRNKNRAQKKSTLFFVCFFHTEKQGENIPYFCVWKKYRIEKRTHKNREKMYYFSSHYFVCFC